MFVDHIHQPKRTRTWCVLFPLATTRRAVIQFVCSDDHCSIDDYDEVDSIPPDSVLDVYREAAAIGHSGSQGLNVLGQLTA